MPSLSLIKQAVQNRRKQRSCLKVKNKHAHKVVKPALPSFRLNGVPAEIQHMIWGNLLNLPACHTFKIRRDRSPIYSTTWSIELLPITERFDPSSYRFWKKMHSLKNISFETAFRHFTTKIQPLALRTLGKPTTSAYKVSAAIDGPNDLVILEFDRGFTATGFEWFRIVHHTNITEHGGLHLIRDRLKHFRKVAIHYKDGHRDSIDGGPFLCCCRPPLSMPCDQFKACPLELACFLDCLPNLQEFYFVVETRLRVEKDFAMNYKRDVTKKGFHLSNTVEPFELARFSDTKNEYIQQAPPKFHPRVAKFSPFNGPGSPRQCISKTMRIYDGQVGDVNFRTPLDRRKKVKFGILIPYELDEKKRPSV